MSLFPGRHCLLKLAVNTKVVGWTAKCQSIYHDCMCDDVGVLVGYFQQVCSSDATEVIRKDKT